MEQLGGMKYLRERKWGTELILIVQCKKERQEVEVPKEDDLKSMKGQGRISTWKEISNNLSTLPWNMREMDYISFVSFPPYYKEGCLSGLKSLSMLFANSSLPLH